MYDFLLFNTQHSLNQRIFWFFYLQSVSSIWTLISISKPALLVQTTNQHHLPGLLKWPRISSPCFHSCFLFCPTVYSQPSWSFWSLSHIMLLFCSKPSLAVKFEVLYVAWLHWASCFPQTCQVDTLASEFFVLIVNLPKIFLSGFFAPLPPSRICSNIIFSVNY